MSRTRRSWWSRARTSAAELDAETLRLEVAELGVRPIEACVVGERCSVAGVITALTLRPRAGVPALAADVFDGTGTVRLLWLGRRRIVGVEPGRRVVASGRLTLQAGTPTVFNPRYRLLARGHG